MSTQCYSWYLVTGGTSNDASLNSSVAAVTAARLNLVPPNTAVVTARLWARMASSSSADPSEVAGTALTPPSASKQITNVFKLMGDMPIVDVSSFGGSIDLLTITYSTTGSYWILTFTTKQPSSAQLIIQSSSSALHGCNVAATTIPIDIGTSASASSSSITAFASSRQPPLSLTTSSTAPATPPSGILSKVYFNPCARNVAYMLYSSSGTTTAIATTDASSVITQTLAAAGGVSTSASAFAAPYVQWVTSPSPGSIKNVAPSILGSSAILTSGAIVLPNGTQWTPPLASRSVILSTIQSPQRCDYLTGYGFSQLSATFAAFAPGSPYLTVLVPTSIATTFSSANQWLTSPLLPPPHPNGAMWAWAAQNVPLNTPTFLLDGVSSVRAVDFDHANQKIVALVRDTSNIDKLVELPLSISDLQQASISDVTTITPAARSVFTGPSAALVLDGNTKGATPGLVYSPTRSGYLFVYGDNLGVSMDAGWTVFPINLVTRNPTLLAAGTSGLATLEYITQVVAAPMPMSVDTTDAAMTATQLSALWTPTSASTGRYAVLTSNNRVFIGALGMRSAYEIKAGLNPVATDTYQLTYSLNGDLTALKRDATNPPYLAAVPVPVNPDLSVSDWNVVGPSCEYANFQVPPPFDYYTDIGDNINITASVVVSSTMSDNLPLMQFGNATLGNCNAALYTSLGAAGVTHTMNATVTADLSAGTDGGVTSLSILPQIAGIGCCAKSLYDSSASLSSPSFSQNLLRAQCPPFRKLVFQAPQVSSAAPQVINCASTTSSYTVSVDPGGWIDYGTGNLGAVSRSMAYNCTRFGQPTPLYYGDSFTPSLAVYDGTNFIANVTADSVFVEILGQNTFRFMSALTAGCIRAPQTTLSMLQGNGRWSRSNYVACYNGTAGHAPASSTQYEIFNSTNGNSFQWKGSKNGMYLFRAIVLDPNYSYCSLSTEFAVYVYGAPLSSGALIGILIGFIALAFILLGVSYYRYRMATISTKIKVE